MKRRAFALTEILTVMAILGVLALTVTPNFLQARTRAKVAKVQEGMRECSMALEMYFVDNKSYPLAFSDSYITPFLPGSGCDSRLLTTPVAYISSVPTDAFKAGLHYPAVFSGLTIHGYCTFDDDAAHRTYPKDSWIITSLGPDQRLNIGGWRPLEIVEAAEKSGSSYPNGPRYDPTNGIISSGDIILFGPNSYSKPPMWP